MLEEKLLGMNSRSFELLFILRWEIVPLFTSNEKLRLNFVLSIRTLREECFVCSYFTRGSVIIRIRIRFNSQCLKRYRNYSNSISLPFARE